LLEGRSDKLEWTTSVSTPKCEKSLLCPQLRQGYVDQDGYVEQLEANFIQAF